MIFAPTVLPISAAVTTSFVVPEPERAMIRSPLPIDGVIVSPITYTWKPRCIRRIAKARPMSPDLPAPRTRIRRSVETSISATIFSTWSRSTRARDSRTLSMRSRVERSYPASRKLSPIVPWKALNPLYSCRYAPPGCGPVAHQWRSVDLIAKLEPREYLRHLDGDVQYRKRDVEVYIHQERKHQYC